MQKYFKILLLVVLALFGLSACGEVTAQDVVKKLGSKWIDTKGYELDAQMTIKAGGEPRVFDVNVWHSKPDLYRVKVSQEGDNVSQMIVRNKEGVFVVTPSLKKTYKFQSDWPKQNSQPYLLEALASDLAADKNVVMREEEGKYIFEAATQNNQKNIMPYQTITIDKKTLLPLEVSILNEAKEEQIHIAFKNVKLDVQHDEKEYAVEQFQESKEDGKKAGAEIEDKTFETHYPLIKWEGTKQVDEKIVKEDGVDRVILTFEGNKAFTLMQQPAKVEESIVPVSAPGDPADLGFTIGAITDHSLTWEVDGISFFLASDKLSRGEMLEVAASVSTGGLK